MTRQTLNISDIQQDTTIQIRAGLDESTVERYREIESLPPIEVFQVDSGYLLTDGFHRIEAAKRNGATEIEADVKTGTRRDAEKAAALANMQHGKPLTKHERNRAIVRLVELIGWGGQTQVAKLVGLTPAAVSAIVANYKKTDESANDSQVSQPVRPVDNSAEALKIMTDVVPTVVYRQEVPTPPYKSEMAELRDEVKADHDNFRQFTYDLAKSKDCLNDAVRMSSQWDWNGHAYLEVARMQVNQLSRLVQKLAATLGESEESGLRLVKDEEPA